MKVDTAIILAGGKSRRMGFDKQLIKINNMLIVDYLAERLKRHFSQIIVVTNRPDLYKDQDYCLTSDVFPGLGPMAGIHAGLLKIKSKAAYVMACDMPNINDDYISYIKERFEKEDLDVLLGSNQGFIEPMAAIYSKDLISDLEKNLKEEKLKLSSIIYENNFKIINYETLKIFNENLNFYDNLNLQEDLDKVKI